MALPSRKSPCTMRGGTSAGWWASSQACSCGISGRSRVAARLPLLRPPPELTGDVTRPLGQVAEPDLGRNDGMERDQGVDERLAGPPAGGVVGEEVRGVVEVVEHDALDVGHHVERRTVDVVAGAQPDHRRHRDAGVLEGRHHPVLPGDVVGGRQHVAHRRTAQHEPLPVVVGDDVRQARVTTGDPAEAQRRTGIGDVVGEPRRDRRRVDAHRCVGRARRPGGVGGVVIVTSGAAGSSAHDGPHRPATPDRSGDRLRPGALGQRSGRPSTPSAKRHSVPRRDSVT